MWNLGFKVLAGLIAAVALSACNNGGQLTLEQGSVKTKSKGSPDAQVNFGGAANITSVDGHSAYVNISAVSASNLTSTSGETMTLNKTTH